MRKSFTAILILLALAATAEATSRRKHTSARSNHTRAAKRPRIVEAFPCPAPVAKNDEVEVINPADEAALQSAIALWMARQPPMGEVAAQKAREIAEAWYRIGMKAGKGSGEARPPEGNEAISEPERQMLLRGLSETSLRAELSHRFLTLFSLLELQAEAERRGLR